MSSIISCPGHEPPDSDAPTAATPPLSWTEPAGAGGSTERIAAPGRSSQTVSMAKPAARPRSALVALSYDGKRWTHSLYIDAGWVSVGRMPAAAGSHRVFSLPRWLRSMPRGELIQLRYDGVRVSARRSLEPRIGYQVTIDGQRLDAGGEQTLRASGEFCILGDIAAAAARSTRMIYEVSREAI
jgi:hypothetical protein